MKWIRRDGSHGERRRRPYATEAVSSNLRFIDRRSFGARLRRPRASRRRECAWNSACEMSADLLTWESCCRCGRLCCRRHARPLAVDWGGDSRQGWASGHRACLKRGSARRARQLPFMAAPRADLRPWFGSRLVADHRRPCHWTVTKQTSVTPLPVERLLEKAYRFCDDERCAETTRLVPRARSGVEDRRGPSHLTSVLRAPTLCARPTKTDVGGGRRGTLEVVFSHSSGPRGTGACGNEVNSVGPASSRCSTTIRRKRLLRGSTTSLSCR